MRMVNNEIEIIRGENFTLDFDIVNSDKSPYILYSGLENPYVLITVSSTKLVNDERYVLNNWLDLSDFPKFENTQPLEVKYESLESFPPTRPDGTPYDEDISGVFTCIDPNTGDRIYKYYSTEGNYEDYNFRVICSFSSEDTINWLERNYEYSITIVDGSTTAQYIRGLYNSIIPESERTETNIYNMYIKLIDTYPQLKEQIMIGAPLAEYTVQIPVLIPTKLTVFSNQNQYFSTKVKNIKGVI